MTDAMGNDDRITWGTYKGDPDAYVEAEQEVSDLIAAGGVPDGSTGTNTEPGEIAPPAVCVTCGKALVVAVRHVERAVAAEAERDRLRAKLHELLARDVDVVDLMNVEYGCPDCGVHHACGEIVAERDRLRVVVRKLVVHAGMSVDVYTGQDWLSYASEEYGGPMPFDPDELAAYRRALDVSPTGEEALER